MSQWSLSSAEKRREQFWRTPPPDPTRQHAKAGIPYYAKRNKLRALMPDDFMPVGPHAGKHLRAVPPDYLAWVDAQPWSKNWVQWQPVSDFISRFIAADPDTAAALDVPAQPVIFVDPLQQWPTKLKCFRDGSSHLHTLPGHLDLLQTFALGALALNPAWFQNKEMPHFDLTVRKHALALQCGAVQVDRRQAVAHLHLWRQFRDSQPRSIPPP